MAVDHTTPRRRPPAEPKRSVPGPRESPGRQITTIVAISQDSDNDSHRFRQRQKLTRNSTTDKDLYRTQNGRFGGDPVRRGWCFGLSSPPIMR